jgi:hypothetical protein
MNETLVRAIIELIASMELTSDEVLDPDVVTGLLEDFSAALEELSGRDRRRLVRIVQEMADSERNPERKSVLADLPEGLGITDDD